MDMQTAVITCFKKSLMTGGRASRSEFWWFALFNSTISFLLIIIESNLLISLWVLITVFPTMCLFIRRFQDINISGWWLLLWPVLVISGFVLMAVASNAEILNKEHDMTLAVIWFVSCIVLILLINCIKGTVGDNRFGKDPLAE